MTTNNLVKGMLIGMAAVIIEATIVDRFIPQVKA